MGNQKPTAEESAFAIEVAKAIGLGDDLKLDGDAAWYRADRAGEWRRFLPQQSWDPAMWAAERAGLFDQSRSDTHGCDLRYLSGGPCWEVYDAMAYWDSDDPECDQSYVISSNQSGPRAICLAILKLKES